MKPLKLIIHTGAPWEPTGYGTQASLLGRWLHKQGHEVIYSARSGLFYQVAQHDGCPVLPSTPFYGDGFQDEMLPGHVAAVQPDAVIVLYDLWNFGLPPERLPRVPFLFWAAVDHSRLGPKEYAYLASGKLYPVAMSQFGKSVIEQAGFSCGYVPHSIQTNKWAPLPSARAEIRQQQFGLPDDAFVIGINATSTDTRRKGLFEQIEAFGDFTRRHPKANAVLMLHTLSNFIWGADVNAMCAEQGLPETAVRITPAYNYLMGIPADWMVGWYNACDLVSNVTYGEGFGLAAIEAQACGVPVVLSDGSTGPELVGPGWLVKTQPAWNETHRAQWHTPLKASITAAYEKAYRIYRQPEQASALRQKAWRFASRYEWEAVSPGWETCLSDALGVPLED